MREIDSKYLTQERLYEIIAVLESTPVAWRSAEFNAALYDSRRALAKFGAPALTVIK